MARRRGRTGGVGWLRKGPLANRNYTLFLVGAFVSSLGSWMQSVALGWTILQISNSTFVLGLLGFVQTAPVLVLGVPGGTLADRADRRTVLLITQSIAAALTVVLAVVQISGHATVAALLALALGTGVVNALNGPSWQAFIKEMVGPDQLRQAIAINSARFNLTRIAGPAVGGWLLVTAGAGACFTANAISFVAVIAAIAMIRTRAVRVPVSGVGGIAGTLAVAREPRIRSVLIPAIGLTVLALPYGSFLPAMARDVFQAGAGGLSLLLTATGVGAFIGAFVSGLPAVARAPGRALAALQIVTGIALAAFAFSPGIYPGMVAIALFGAALIAYLSTANATIQLAAAPGTEGRALGLWMIVNSGLVPIGSLVIGGLSDLFTVRFALGCAGAGCGLAGVAATYANRRALRRRPIPASP